MARKSISMLCVCVCVRVGAEDEGIFIRKCVARGCTPRGCSADRDERQQEAAPETPKMEEDRSERERLA